MTDAQVLIIGPSGCGKSSLGRALAAAINCDFIDADDMHSVQAIARMKQGIPLTENLRAPWLARLANSLNDYASRPASLVMAVSGLKKTHRHQLRTSCHQPIIFFLDLPEDMLRERITNRVSHFFPSSLLDSQLATLEKPTQHEGVISLNAALPIPVLCQRCLEVLCV